MKIKKLKIKSRFSYLWLKNVVDVDLNVHCARCLIGKYDKRISPQTKEIQNIELNDDIYYLCGVSMPYRWEKNFHLAFIKSDNDVIEIDENGIEAVIEGAKRIDINSDYIDKGTTKSKQFTTCRNWQFANIFEKLYKKGKNEC